MSSFLCWDLFPDFPARYGALGLSGGLQTHGQWGPADNISQRSVTLPASAVGQEDVAYSILNFGVRATGTRDGHLMA
jgi:hypothetical protein